VGPYQDDGTATMSWLVDTSLDVPPSRQLVEAVLDAIVRGELAAGAKLPSVRGMAAEALVNANTVAKAYRDLEQMGAVRGENGRGVFVTAAGEEVACAARLDATLDAFRRAALEALRTGHDVTRLTSILLELQARKTA